MSPNEQKMTSGRCAMACALSIISSDVTQTGQPGPCTSSISLGNSRSIPYLTMVWVCPPQTSIRTHGSVVMRRISSTIFVANASSRYSSRNFMSALLRYQCHSDPHQAPRVRLSLARERIEVRVGAVLKIRCRLPPAYPTLRAVSFPREVGTYAPLHLHLPCSAQSRHEPGRNRRPRPPACIRDRPVSRCRRNLRGPSSRPQDRS